jgi:hypothetical protein
MIGQIVTATVVATTPSPKKVGANNGVILRLPDGGTGYLYFRRCAGETFDEQVNMLESISQPGTEVEVVVGNPTRLAIGGSEVECFRCSQLAATRRRQQEWVAHALAEKVEFDGRVSAVRPNYAIVEFNDGITGTLHVTRMVGSPDSAEARLQALNPGDPIKVVISETTEHGRVRVAEVA